MCVLLASHAHAHAPDTDIAFVQWLKAYMRRHTANYTGPDSAELCVRDGVKDLPACRARNFFSHSLYELDDDKDNFAEQILLFLALDEGIA